MGADLTFSPAEEHMTDDQYREGHKYVVCETCGSEILLTHRECYAPEEGTCLVGFTCDNDDCEADFFAEVHALTDIASVP